MVRLLPIPKLRNTDSPTHFISEKHKIVHLINNTCTSQTQLTQIHAQILIHGLQDDTFLTSQLIRLCTLSPHLTKNLNYAKTLLYISHKLPTSSWNMVIRGYADSKTPKHGLFVYKSMKGRNVRVNKLTFPFVFKAAAECLELRLGMQAQCDVLKNGLWTDLYVCNSLVSFYGCCSRLKDAIKVFDEMPERSVVSWNSVVDACVGNLSLGDGVGFFLRMRMCGFEPDETMVVVLLSGCSEAGNLSLGKWVHGMVVIRGMGLWDCYVGTALVDMYAKCGDVSFARFVFDRQREKNVCSWSAMILGLAQHGFARDAVDVFERMMRDGSVQPNYVTFLGVLCACSHTGLVDDGYMYFRDMKRAYGIEPMMIHYGAMVDMLGRAGRLKEAYDFVLNMPIEPDPVIWRTLLSACSIHDVKDNDGVGDAVRNRLLELEPQRGGNLVMVANMYAEAGMWDKTAKIRMVMKEGEVKKVAGESCVELCGSMHKFHSGDDLELDCKAIYDVLNVLSEHTKPINYND